MDASGKDALAAEYALGTLDSEARSGVDRDPQLRELADQWEARLAPLSDGIAEIDPPGHVWDGILSAIDRVDENPPGTTTLRRTEGEWETMLPGATMKILSVDNVTKMRSFLLRLEPGIRIPGHGHGKLEECYVIDGEVTIGSLTLRPGDYHFVPPGVAHPTITSAAGGLLFIRGEAKEAA